MKTVMKKQSGFTLIELIMVIVILGILAAVALPKFVNLGADARTAAVKALDGSMRATNSIIYAKANINNAMGATSSVTINGQPINTVYGYGSTVVSGIAPLMDLSADFDSTTTANLIFHKAATTPGATCGVAYTPATATAAPTYAPVTTGC